jgi:clan AA aspartic protease (TIGR02281 family)
MVNNRLLVLALSGAIWALACTRSPAVDINPPQSNEWSEATAFFNQLITTSKNPVIVNMARENLLKMQQPLPPQAESCAMQPVAYRPTEADIPLNRTVTEVKLLPQSDNTYVVPAIINKKHMATFLIDTGASYTVITPQMARQLGLHLTDENTSVPVTTANGTVNAPLVTLKQLSLGGLRVDNVEAVVADLGDAPQLSGLLGMSFFHGMDLSFKRDRLVIGH